MSTATLTPTTAAEQLLADVRQVLEQHPGADDVDELRAMADELAAVLRRVRGRIKRITKRDTPTRTPDENRQVSARAGDEAGTQPAEPPAPGPALVLTDADVLRCGCLIRIVMDEGHQEGCADLQSAPPRSRVVLDGGEAPTQILPASGELPVSGDLPAPHGEHRAEVATVPLAELLRQARRDGWCRELHRWATGQHRQKPQSGRGWKVLIAALILVPLLVLVVAQVKYEQQDRVTPWHGVPATTGQTPTPPVAGDRDE